MYLEHGSNWSKYKIENRTSGNVKDRMRTIQTIMKANSFESAAAQWISQYNEEQNE